MQIKVESGFISAEVVPGYDIKKLDGSEVKISETSTYSGFH